MNIAKICCLPVLLLFCCKSNPKATPEETKSHEEVSCKQSTVFEYKGLTGTAELTQLLDTSSKPFIKGMTDSTKRSLIKYLQFQNGMAEKFNGSDENIKNFYATNAYEVFKEILGSEVILCTLNTKPAVTPLSLDEFEAMKRQASLVQYISSWCTDCTKTDDAPCCITAGDGCRDNLIRIDQAYYSVK